MIDSARTEIREHRRCPEYAEFCPTEQVNCNLRPIRRVRDTRRRNRCYRPGGAEINVRNYGHGSDHVGETIQVAAVTKPKPPPDRLDDLLTRLRVNMAAPVLVSAPVHEVRAAAELRQRLVADINRFGSYLSGQQTSGPQIWRMPVERNRDGIGCFFMWKVGSCCDSLPELE